MKVTIENQDDRLRLRWTCPETGKRKTLALGVADCNTVPETQLLAEHARNPTSNLYEEVGFLVEA
jgi:hypothetical protein